MKIISAGLIALLSIEALAHTKQPEPKLQREYSKKYDVVPQPPDCTLKKVNGYFTLPAGTLDNLIHPDLTLYDLHSRTSSVWGKDQPLVVEQTFYVSKDKRKTPYWTYRTFSTNGRVWSLYYYETRGCFAWLINTEGKGFDKDATGQSIGPEDIPVWVSP